MRRLYQWLRDGATSFRARRSRGGGGPTLVRTEITVLHQERTLLVCGHGLPNTALCPMCGHALEGNAQSPLQGARRRPANAKNSIGESTK